MAKGSAGDIATLGVAAFAVYFIYKLTTGMGNGLLPGEVAGPVYVPGINPSTVIAPVATAPTAGAIGLDATETKQQGAALSEVFKTLYNTTPSVALAPQPPSIMDEVGDFFGLGPA